jgi:AcrR family transcriptional regulator
MASTEPYHHENLRQTLLEAAVTLIGEVGPRAFTLREVARRAGVSHNAPYRHFPSKDDLLVAVASEGFERLTAVMKKSLAKGKSALEQLQLCGCGYVDFALHWPHHFLVMFDLVMFDLVMLDLPGDSATGCVQEQVGKNAFDVLMNCILRAQQSGELPVGDPLPLAWTAWSLVHGIAKLAVSGNLPLNRAATLSFTRQATVVLTGGMMNSEAKAR